MTARKPGPLEITESSLQLSIDVQNLNIISVFYFPACHWVFYASTLYSTVDAKKLSTMTLLHFLMFIIIAHCEGSRLNGS
jgi:hypothetical protein